MTSRRGKAFPPAMPGSTLRPSPLPHPRKCRALPLRPQPRLLDLNPLSRSHLCHGQFVRSRCVLFEGAHHGVKDEGDAQKARADHEEQDLPLGGLRACILHIVCCRCLVRGLRKGGQVVYGGIQRLPVDILDIWSFQVDVAPES